MQKTFWATAGVGLVACAAIAGVIIGTSNAATPASADSTDIALTNALTPSFSHPQTATDALPGFLVSGAQSLPDIKPESSRALGTVDQIRYWIVNDNLGRTCLVSLLPGKEELATMTCDRAEGIWAHGLALQTATATSATRAYFVPQGYSSSPAGLTRAGQLLVGSGEQPSKAIKLSSDPTARTFTSATGAVVGDKIVTLPALPSARPPRP